MTDPTNDTEQATDWQRIDAALDLKAGQTLGSMMKHLRDDLSSRLPNKQAVFYRGGTVCDATKIEPALAVLQTRLKLAMNGEPAPQDQQAFNRGTAPQYAAFLHAEYPEKQRALDAFKHQMAEAASAYVRYSECMLYASFPDGVATPDTQSARELQEAIAKPLLRAYCCMQMLRPCADTGMGFTDNSMVLMQAFDFMKEIAEADIRKQLGEAPKAAPKTNDVPASTVRDAIISPARPKFGAQQPTSEAALARLRAEAEAKRAAETPAKKGWFSR